jgi:non-lysosomal glucosylceramidase
MPRNCNCSAGACGPQADGVTRREFIQLVGIGAAGVMVASAADAAKLLSPTQLDELAKWKQALHQPAAPRRYRSDVHKDARMHLGGIGTGNFELGADGQFTTWQLFNTLRDGFVPMLFAVKAGKTAKILQTTGGPGLPNIKSAEMTGEYPLATLRFEDPEIPVHIQMTAFTPFTPLDSKLSSMPASAFVFRIHNPTGENQTVSLAAMVQNPVGYDAMGVPISFNSVGFNSVPPYWRSEHPNFGGNINEVRTEGNTALLTMRANAGREPALDKSLNIITNLNVGALNSPPKDRPANMTITGLDQIFTIMQASDASKPRPRNVIWLEEPASDLHETQLRAVRDAVKEGATLVFSGQQMPLLVEHAQATKGKAVEQANLRSDVVFEDFEHGYGNWKVEGKAFGTAPSTGTLPFQQQVSGFLGKGLVNSFVGGDDPMGKMTSKEFKIDRNYIKFLVGGGSQASTQIRLLMDGQIVRATAGKENERLLPAMWDVRDLKGKTAHIEIVDQQTGGWGHINVDQIEFSDLPSNVATLKMLEELLPIRYTNVFQTQTGIEFQNAKLNADSKQTVSSKGMLYYSRKVGGGSVVVATASLLNPETAELTGARQKAYEGLVELAGGHYTSPNGVPATAPGFGTLALATTGPNPTAMPSFTDWKAVWETFSQGGFSPAAAATTNASPAGHTHNGALASTMEVGPGKTVEIPFFLAWHYPNKFNQNGVWMGNHYCTLWPNAQAAALDISHNFGSVRDKAERFRSAFYDSTLPYWFLDCLTSQMSIIRHVGVVFRIANGDTYGWEGSNGCCPPTCTHVWGYEQTLARVFPDLERDMRRIDLKHQQRKDGGINNRTEVPSPPRPTGETPFVDGHASCVLKAYREALNHPDDAWLRANWAEIKKAVDYLIGRDPGSKNGYPEGILSDDQWNTYDEAIHGVNTFIGSYYLAALRAGEEMARRMGDQTTGNHYRTIFERGREKLDQMCWNGEYYHQNLPDYLKMGGEYGPGCLSDQMIGQWWAHQLGLGYVLPQERVRTALKSVFKYNWLPDHTNWKHNWRKFAGGKDKGLLICSWPKGGRPEHPILYCDEVWTGVEYQVASHMIYEGMMDEALAIIKGVRDRYDGVPRDPMPRNPWNEIECGGHYARAMSSWSLLLAISGFEYNGIDGALRFTPRHTPDNFKSFFTGPEGWGNVKQTRTARTQKNEIKVVDGQFTVSSLHLAPQMAAKRVRISVGGRTIPATLKTAMEGVHVSLEAPVTLKQGETLTVSLA